MSPFPGQYWLGVVFFWGFFVTFLVALFWLRSVFFAVYLFFVFLPYFPVSFLRVFLFPPGPQTVEEGAEIIVRAAQFGPDGPTGAYLDREGTLPW